MKIKSFTKLFIFSLLVTFCSCTKEYSDTSLKNGAAVSSDIPTFKSFSEYRSAIEKTINMTDSELKDYEESRGYKSFGRICNEVYSSIQPENFKSIEEIKEFVSKQSMYLTLQTDKTGDIYCLPQEFDNNERFVLNKDKMYIIDGFVYRKFDDLTVYSNIKNLVKLKNVVSNEEVMNNPLFSIQKKDYESSSFTKKEQYEKPNDVGRYRLKLFIQTETFHYSTPWKWETHRETEYKITNYKKTLGVWFQNSLNTTFNIFLQSYDDISGDYREVSSSGTNVYNNVISYSDKYFIQEGLTWDYVPYFSYYYATARNSQGCTVTFQQ